MIRRTMIARTTKPIVDTSIMLLGNGEWGMGSGSRESNFHIPHSLFLTPYSPSPQITQYLARRVESRRAHHASARMRARTTKVKVPDRRSVLRPPGHGAHEEQLVEVHLAVKDVAAGQAVLSLHVQRRNHLTMQGDVLDVRRVFGKSVDAAVGEPLFHRLVPGGVLERIGRVLSEYAHDVFARRRDRIVVSRRDGAFEHRIG